MEEPRIVADKTEELAHTRFVKLYQLAYEDGGRYFVASRHDRDDLRALVDPAERACALPDAVSCCLVLAPDGAKPRLVLFWEYRYPTGQYVLSIPSGLIDADDAQRAEPLVAAMTREIGEECGIVVGERDRIWVLNPLLFNSPGFTDESTALLCAVVRQDAAHLSQAGAEGSERFDGFVLLDEEQARQVLAQGTDPQGQPYPMVTWAALSYFVSGAWRS